MKNFLLAWLLMLGLVVGVGLGAVVVVAPMLWCYYHGHGFLAGLLFLLWSTAAIAFCATKGNEPT